MEEQIREEVVAEVDGKPVAASKTVAKKTTGRAARKTK